MVISSTLRAAQLHGGALGQYEYHEDRGCYVQTSTEQNEEKFEAHYLYRDKDDEWWVSDTPGARTGILYNTRTSQTPPTSGWKWGDGESWYFDQTLTVTPGPLPYLPMQFMVTAMGVAAEKFPSFLGVFTRTERWWNGMPVYVNTEGRLLHHGNGDLGWMIGDKVGYYALRGSKAHHSPVSENRWCYWTGTRLKLASVTVTGSGGVAQHQGGNAEPESEPEPEPEQEPEAESEPEPDPEQESEPESEPEQVPEPEQEPEQKPESESERKQEPEQNDEKFEALYLYQKNDEWMVGSKSDESDADQFPVW